MRRGAGPAFGAFIALGGLALSCGGPAKEAAAGESCFRSTECQAGLVCIDRVCTADLTTIDIHPDAATAAGGAANGGSAGSAGAGGGAGVAGSAGAANGGASGNAGAAGSAAAGGAGGATTTTGGGAGAGGGAGSGPADAAVD